ncbi:MAG TPA: hypothetical protein VHX61_11865 [Rhizomicrobium sp.]|nr:hypothetical protein [Rhizomicrobium sp.]
MSGRTNEAPGKRLLLAAAIAVTAIAALHHALELAVRLAQTSDSAQGFVAGHAIAGGNLLLSGWHFPVDDYYFTDAVPYAAFERLAGARPFLLALVPAVTYVLFVLAALVCSTGASRPLLKNLESAAAVALLLSAPVWIGRWDPFLLSDMHFATVLGAFIALALCTHIAGLESPDATPLVPAALTLLVITSATVASDPFSLVFAFGPALTVIAAEAVLRPGRMTRIALSLLLAGIALGLFLPPAIASAGGFTTEDDVLPGLVSARFLGRNLIALLFGMFRLFGADFAEMHRGFWSTLLLIIRCTALGIVVAAVIRAARRLPGRDRALLFDRFLCAGTITVLAACAVSAQFAKGITPQNLWVGGPVMRYIMPAMLFGSMLAAREMPDMLAALPSARLRNTARGILGFIAAVVLIAGGSLSWAAAQPDWIARNPPAIAARWLARHRLVEGVGEYWSANLITAISGDEVRVRSVVAADGKLAPYVWVEDGRWYARAPQFVVWQDNNQTGLGFRDVSATYAICRTALVAGYRIAILTDAPGSASACWGAKHPTGETALPKNR